MGCLYFIVLLFPFFIVAGMGHCEPAPGVTCEGGPSLLWWTLLATGPAVLLGAASRVLFHWLGQLITAQEESPDPAPRAPWWAFAALLLALGGGTWLVWGEPPWRLW
jgi:hypothetical protein